MNQTRSRIPFKCPKCGHETKRGLREGGVLSRTFKCDSCGQRSTASTYVLASVLYAIGLVGVLGGVTLLLTSFRWAISFEYASIVALLIVLAIIFFFSDYYWKLTLRWNETD